MRTRGFLLGIFLLTSPLSSSSAQSINVKDPRKLVNLAPHLSSYVAKLALDAAHCAAEKLNLKSVDKLAVIDYSLPSTQKRFWLFDMNRSRLLLEDLVAHGRNTGENKAAFFSNLPGSLQSSLGIFQVGERYIGKHGTSLRLIGLEHGFNDQALNRDIVIHGADYVSQSFIQLHQRIGRSFGCPALPPESNAKVVDSFRDGEGFLFAYYPDKQWLQNSTYLNGCNAT